MQLANMKYTDSQLKQAFDNVKSERGWKYAINKVIEDPGRENLDCLNEAIIFYTSSFPTYTRLTSGKIRVKAPGYYRSVRGA